VAALVAAAAAVGAVAPARAAVVSAVGSLLRVAGIEVNTSPTAAPTLPARPSPLPSEHLTTLDEARRVALFEVRLPAALGTPEMVTLADQDKTGAPRVVTLTYRGGKVRLDEFDGELSIIFLKQAPDAQWVEVGADSGIWLPGPHPVTYVGRDGAEHTATARLAAPTLIWQSGKVTYRLEGMSTLDDALAAARSVG
jgi:hypothetical protein